MRSQLPLFRSNVAKDDQNIVIGMGVATPTKESTANHTACQAAVAWNLGVSTGQHTSHVTWSSVGVCTSMSSRAEATRSISISVCTSAEAQWGSKWAINLTTQVNGSQGGKCNFMTGVGWNVDLAQDLCNEITNRAEDGWNINLTQVNLCTSMKKADIRWNIDSAQPQMCGSLHSKTEGSQGTMTTKQAERNLVEVLGGVCLIDYLD